MCKSELIIGDYNKCIDPVLSIVIPTYGRAEYLVKAIDSVLNQNVKENSVEIIVVSNDPNDSLKEIIERYDGIDNFFLYRNEENIGMVRNSNQCVNLSRGKYVAFLHDDDYLLDNYLSVVKKYVLNDSKIKCFIPGRYIMYENDCISYRNAVKKSLFRKIYFFPNLWRRSLRKVTLKDNLMAGTNCYFSPSCGTVFEKEAFMQNKGFDNEIKYSWDFDFFLKFNVQNDIYSCTEICSVYRMAANASLRSEVKYEFFSYYKDNFMRLIKLHHIDDKYVKNNEDIIVYTVYKQWAEELESELNRRGEEVPKVNKVRWVLYKIKTWLYYYNHNLDIQRPAKMGELS